MNILLFVKQVPTSEDVKFDEKGNMIRENCDLAINYADDYALENALILKSINPSIKIIALSMGPENASNTLRYCISRGADEAYLLTDNALRGADTLITAKALSLAALKLKELKGEIGLFFCGAKSSDGETAHVPSQIAQMLSLPDIVFADIVESLSSEHIIVSSRKDNLIKQFKASLPCLVSFQPSDQITIKLPSIINRMKAKKTNIENLSLKDINLNIQTNAQESSPTWVGKYFEDKRKNTKQNTKNITIAEIASLLKEEIKK